jgi:hypothetical protein
MAPQPLLDFLFILPAFITTAPPVIGVSEQAQVKVLLWLVRVALALTNRSLKNIFIDPRILKSPSNLRANILEAIEDAQKSRERQVQLIISQNACVAKLSLWDVEATLLAVKSQQAAASVNTHCCARNRLVSLRRGRRGEIDRLMLNSMRFCDSRELERSIIDAAGLGYEKVRDSQRDWPFSELGWL